METSIVQFTSAWKGYGKGVKASFPTYLAEILVERGLCRIAPSIETKAIEPTTRNPLSRMVKKGK